MATSVIGVLQDVAPDKYWWTDSRTVSAVTKEAQYVLQAPSAWPTYTFLGTGVATTTSASHLAMLQADGALYLRIYRIRVQQAALAGAVATAQLQLLRVTTAGSGGGTVNGRPLNGANTDPYAGVVQTLPTVKGTEGNLLLQGRLGLTATNPVTTDNVWEWNAKDTTEEIIIGTATSGGCVVKIVTGVASSTIDWEISAFVTSFL